MLTGSNQPVSGHDLKDFVYHREAHKFIFVPTGALWPVDAVRYTVGDLGVSKIVTLHSVDQLVWAPGEAQIIKGRVLVDGGWIEHASSVAFNLYRKPTLVPQHGNAEPWIRHVEYVYPDDYDHIIRCLAFKLQFPGIKLNHALVLGGAQRIGKDTILEPVKRAMGHWNFRETHAKKIVGRFNHFLQCVILRINEAKDLGDISRYEFYETMKDIITAPPDVNEIDRKNMPEYYIANVRFVIYTTNYKSGGIHLPEDDGRHYVAWSPRTREQFPPDYFDRFYKWLDTGGTRFVAHYLLNLDLTGFDPKAPPLKTQAWWDMVSANAVPEDGELADALDKLGRPDALTLSDILTVTSEDFKTYLRDRRNSRKVSHRMEDAGYVPYREPGIKSGLFVVKGRRQVIYVKANLSPAQQSAAAMRLTIPEASPLPTIKQ